ncbi:uncharacterized protein BDR25DRAFT_33813 [Lindgomyces ingoldianus]|uniref:Uncharacterized protein n=1 Tax=Lindgomyces ingoldianus TaxID=673940 RepID=A0ACB6QTH0_9PLEO|nr:uncharacterized protein BDR25DRAFT_33813 [Lindgomyces ingoldianus]KAF2470313.1 hypothetical protein BDR25DRAFT_33813 [Lindgomyces ingoldianus]
MARPTKRLHISEGGTVDIPGKTLPVFVGEAQEVFYVHENLLRNGSSEYFKKLLQYGGETWHSKPIDLSHEDVPTFRLFNKWLYDGSLLPKDDAASISDRDFRLLVNACAFGERLRDIPFTKAITDAIIDCHNKIKAVPGPVLITSFYEATDDSCPVRQLFADMWAFLAKDEWIEQKLSQCPRGFVEDLVRAYHKHRYCFSTDNPLPWSESREQYYRLLDATPTENPCEKFDQE